MKLNLIKIEDYESCDPTFAHEKDQSQKLTMWLLNN